MSASKVMKIAAAVFFAVVAVSIVVKAYVVPAVEQGAAEAAARAGVQQGSVEERAGQVRVSGDQQAMIEAYAGDTLDLAELLEANAWVKPDGSKLEFARGRYLYTGQDGSRESGNLVLGAPKTTSATEGGKAVQRTVCAVTASDALGILTVERVKADAGEVLTVSLDTLEDKEAFERANSSREIVVEKPKAELVDIVGGEEAFAKLAQGLGEHVSQRHPSATKAVWVAKANVDYEQGKVTLSYKLDDRAETTVEVEAPIGGGEPKFTSG